MALATVHSRGDVDSPRLVVELRGPDLDAGAVAQAQDRIAWMLGIDQDLQPFYRMASADAHLAPLLAGLRGLHVFHTASVFEALVLAILGQQISTHVAHMLRTLLIETYGDAIDLEGGTFHAFPRPEALVTAGVEGLRAIKFSTRKSEYTRRGPLDCAVAADTRAGSTRRLPPRRPGPPAFPRTAE